MADSNSATKQRPASQLVEITEQDLPIYCPSEKSALWAEHPRVYLRLDDENHVICPYCNTEYRVKG